MKRRKLIYAVLLGLFICYLSGCSQEGLDTYDLGETSVYFGVENTNASQSNVFVDTTIFSFGDYSNITDTTLYIQVNALGGLSPVDREFEFEVVDSLTTAEGFYTLTGTKGVIPAYSTEGYIPVRLTYSEEMKKRPMFYLVLQLKPNANFNLDLQLEYVDKTNDKYIQLTRHCVGVSSRIQKPKMWYVVEQYFLDYSSDKYKLINELCHLTKDDWTTMTFYIGEAYWVAVRNHLQKCIDEGNPVMEENDRTGRKQIMKVRGLTGVN